MKELLYHLDDLSDVVPFFSPASFLVFLNDNDTTPDLFQNPEIEAAVFAGELRRANELVREQASNLSPTAEAFALQRFTAIYHEFKHYWDHVGTTYGLARLGLAVRRQLDMLSLIELIPQGEPLTLPMLANTAYNWSDGSLAKKLLDDITETLFREQVLDDVGIRIFMVDRPPQDCPPEARIVVAGPSETHWVPAYAIRGVDEEGHTWIIAVPFGGRAICEGAAMALELDVLAGVFGSWAADARKRDFMGFDHDNPERSYYGACDLFLSRHVESFPYDLLIAMCDLALLGEVDGSERESFHPGWRFRKLVDLVAERGWPSGQALESDAWENWYMDLFLSLNKRPLGEFLKETRAWLAEKIAPISMDGGLASVISAIYQQADRIFELRQQDPLILASGENLYKSMASTFYDGPLPENLRHLTSVKLPKPTVVMASSADVIAGVSDAGDQIRLAVQGKVLSDLLFGHQIVCPLVASGFNCPRKKPGCGQIPGVFSPSEHPECSFKSTVREIRILDRPIVVMEE